MSAAEAGEQTPSDDTAVRPFQVSFPEAELAELRRRINATRWPERETVSDDSQGVPLATMRELARYWGTDYDWGKCEAKLNALPHSITEIDGLDIHFIHVRSEHEDALPLIVTHGWPGSIIEQLNIIGPLNREDGWDHPAYDPAMMVALLLYAYARGVNCPLLARTATTPTTSPWFSGARHAPIPSRTRARDEVAPWTEKRSC
jgi:hypothetical protein